MIDTFSTFPRQTLYCGVHDMNLPSPDNGSQLVGSTVDAAVDTAKDVIDKTASWADDHAANSDVSHRVERLSETAMRTVDAASSTVKQTADAAWDVAQKTKGQAADMARDVYQRSQQIGADVVRQAQEQPVIAVLMALSAGVVIGFSLSMLFKSR
jgi:hypothetical protein